MHSESPSSIPESPYLQIFTVPFALSCSGLPIAAESRAQGAIGEKVMRPEIGPPPVVPVRRTSSGKGVGRGLLVKRKNESQGIAGEGKRRRSSVTESPKTETSTQQSPLTKTSASSIISTLPTVAKGEDAIKNSPPTKDGTTKGLLTGFDEYSDSDTDSD